MRKRIALGVLSFAFIVVLGVILLANQVDETWEDTHWGGDVGEEEYSETRSEDGTEEGDICNTGVCGTAVIFGVVVPSYAFTMKRSKNE